MNDLPFIVDRTSDLQRRAGQKCRVTGLKGDLGKYNGLVFEPTANRGSETGWIISPEKNLTMVLSESNIEWTR
jgi:hypothetical protein